jgi:hypothetical protein
MLRPFLICATITLCLHASIVHAQRGREPARPNNNEREKGGGNQREQKGGGGERERQGSSQPPGGDWSERTHSGSQAGGQFGQRNESGAGVEAANRNRGNESNASAGAAAERNRQPNASGAQGAATGTAYGNRNAPQATGAQGAAAGAAAANRNSPQYSGAEGAAAGAAAVNRNAPQYSGAQGAALGAAAANQNNPQYSGAQGAALGAALLNQNNNVHLSGTQGAALGAGAVNQTAAAIPGVGVAPVASTPAAGAASVRSAFGTTELHGAAWYGNNPTAWSPAGWSAGSAWRQPTWVDVSNVCGYGSAAPFSYNYGVNIVSKDGNVVANGQNVGTVADFSQQAFDIAEAGTAAQPATTDQWLPLGVFAMVRNEQQQPHLILQLAVDRQGTLRGNYTDDVSGTTLPVRGAVDKPSQRAAWTVGDNKQTVMESGISDLTGNEAPALIHKSGKTDHWLLVRLTQPRPRN